MNRVLPRAFTILLFEVFLQNAFGITTISSTLHPVKMANSNPVLEMIVDGIPTKLILTTDIDGIIVCADANTSRSNWHMTDSDFDSARKRLRYELQWVEPEINEHEVQVPALDYSGRINVGFVTLKNQEMNLAAVEYYLGSSGFDGFIGASFTFYLKQSPLWGTVQVVEANSAWYKYLGRQSFVSRAIRKDSAEIPRSQNRKEVGDSVESPDSDHYVWSEPFVSLGEDNSSSAQGISFPIHEASFRCKIPQRGGSDDEGQTKDQSVQLFGGVSSYWDVVVDFNTPCLTLPREFYDSLAGWVGLQSDSMAGLSEIASPASGLPNLYFTLAFGSTELALPLQALVLEELSKPASSTAVANITKVCIQRSSSLLQMGTAAFAASTTAAAEVSRLQRLQGGTGIPLYNMIDTPIVFGAMVLDALGSVVFDGTTKRTGIKVSSSVERTDRAAVLCAAPVVCIGTQQYVEHLNTCEDPDCSQYLFHRLDESTKLCVVSSSWTLMLIVTTALFVAAELFLSLSLRRLVIQSQQPTATHSPVSSSRGAGQR